MPKNACPAVSVCIPTYLGARHIGAAIDSVLAQSFSDFELLIIDDNSPDETAALVDHYQDSRIRFLRNERNLGPEGNWNRCLAESRGKYFKLLPQDDLLYPGCLEKQVSILEEDVQQLFALVFCSRKIIDAQNRVVTTRRYPNGKNGVIFGPSLMQCCLRYGTNLIGEPGSVLLRKSLAQQVGYFDGSIPYIIDLDYWFRLLLHGQAYYLSEPLAAFRISPGSWSVSIGARQSTDFREFIKKVSQIPRYKFTYFDIYAGHVMARINNFFRLIFYRFLLNQKTLMIH